MSLTRTYRIRKVPTMDNLPTAASNPTARRAMTSVIVFAVLCVVGIGAGIYYVYFMPKGESTLSTHDELVAARRAGEYEVALAKYRTIIEDPSKTSEQKAWATVNFAGAEFHGTGDAKKQLEDIGNLKKIVVDTTVSTKTRAAAVSVLSMMYNNSGRSPAVFAEIYREEPFNNYLVPGDPDLSALKLAEWSYSLNPTSNAAVYVAQLYAARYFLNPSQSAASTTVYSALAEDYLQKAESVAKEEVVNDPSFAQSDRYIAYLTWRAITIGRLAVSKGEPYASNYRSTYEDFISFARSRGTEAAKEQLFFARFQFARILMLRADLPAAKEQLDTLAEEMRLLADPDSRSFIWFLRNEYTYRREEPTWVAIQTMLIVSPEFKTEVEKVVGAQL